MTAEYHSGRWSILTDGSLYVFDDCHRFPRAGARRVARSLSKHQPALRVAICVLGDPETLTRFEAGREVLP